MIAALVYLLISITVSLWGASMIDSNPTVGMSILGVYWGANALLLFGFMAFGGGPTDPAAVNKAIEEFNEVWDNKEHPYRRDEIYRLYDNYCTVAGISTDTTEGFRYPWDRRLHQTGHRFRGIGRPLATPEELARGR